MEQCRAARYPSNTLGNSSSQRSFSSFTIFKMIAAGSGSSSPQAHSMLACMRCKSPWNSVPWPVWSTTGHPCCAIILSKNNLAILFAYLLGIAAASTHLLKESQHTTRYSFPCVLRGSGPHRSMCTRSRAFTTVLHTYNLSSTPAAQEGAQIGAGGRGAFLLAPCLTIPPGPQRSGGA